MLTASLFRCTVEEIDFGNVVFLGDDVHDTCDRVRTVDGGCTILQDFDVPIIFITAFPERLLTGERPEPTYLISKPFQESTVKAAIAQALFFHPNKAEAAA